MPKIACSNCGSPNLTEISPNHFRCHHCESKFSLDARPAEPRLPPVPGLPQRGVRSAGTLVVLALCLVALALVGGGLVWFLVRTPRGREIAAQPTTAAAPAPTSPGASGGSPVLGAPESRHEMPAVVSKPVVPEEPPKAELRDVHSGTTSIGGLFWIVSYVNTGKVPIGHPAAVASLFDEEGHRVGEHAGYATLEDLPPGESTPILVLVSDPPKYAKLDLKPRDPQPIQFSAKQVPLSVVEHSVIKDILGRSVIGTVRNDRTAPVHFVQVVVLGRGASGEMVSYASGYATAQKLEPNETSGFKASVGTFQLAEPASYDVFAIGREN